MIPGHVHQLRNAIAFLSSCTWPGIMH